MVTFEDLEMTTLKKIIRLYNSHIKIPYTRKKVKLTQQELIEEMKKHLIIENNIVKLKPDNYNINVDELMPKKKQKKGKKEEPKKEEPKKEEPKKEEPKKEEPKKEEPKDKILEEYNYLTKLDDSWFNKYTQDKDVAKLIRVIKGDKEYNLNLDLSKIAYPILDWIDYYRLAIKRNELPELIKTFDLNNYKSKNPKWILEKVKDDYNYLVDPRVDFANQDRKNIDMDLNKIRKVDRLNKKYKLKYDLKKIEDEIKIFIGNMDEKFGFDINDLYDVVGIKAGYKNKQFEKLKKEGRYDEFK